MKELTAQINVLVRKECEDAFNGPNAKVSHPKKFFLNHLEYFYLIQNFTPNQHFTDVCKIIDVIDTKLRLVITRSIILHFFSFQTRSYKLVLKNTSI